MPGLVAAEGHDTLGKKPSGVAGEVVKLEKDLGGAYKANPNYAWQRAVSPRPRNSYRVASSKVTEDI